ncbi:putative ribonuclease H-like domain-containing protein [Tanacetum coccineum]
MLANSLLPTTFWAESINTACYVQNRVLVTKPHNKTPYELLIGRPPNLYFMRRFGCSITILNTLDHLGKFEGKADEGFLVGYSINSKAFRVFNTSTRKVEENLHIKFLENKSNVAGSGPEWLFDIDSLTKSMNYEPVTTGNQTNGDAGIKTKVKQKDDGIFINQDKYMADILKKFDFVTVKTASTPIEPNKALLKDTKAEDVDVHLYRSMIGSLMYLTTYRPDITFAVCACARDSPFDLEAFSDSDYASASLDRKSTTGEYVAAANCCGQVLWIQNQMLDYGFNFMNTKIYIDNESTICIVKNPVFHSKTKHIEIRHHFIRDSYEKRLIQVIKIHTDHNVADLLTKAFDVSSDEFGVKTGSCKVNVARHKLVLLSKVSTAKPKLVLLSQCYYYLRARAYGVGDRVERAATNAASLDAAQDMKVEGLESDLMKIKKLYATAFKELISRVKSLEGEESHRRNGFGCWNFIVPHMLKFRGGYGYEFWKLNEDTTADDLTIAKTLMEIRKSAAKDKSKAKMDETESLRKMKQRERVQISRDEEVAQKLQEEFDAAERQRMAQVHPASSRGFTDAD